jgi:hypothetical protein
MFLKVKKGALSEVYCSNVVACEYVRSTEVSICGAFSDTLLILTQLNRDISLAAFGGGKVQHLTPTVLSLSLVFVIKSFH